MTNQVFRRHNQMAKCDFSKAYLLACSLLYRGDVAHKEAISALRSLRNTSNAKFVDWNPTGFKVSISSQTSEPIDFDSLRKPVRDCFLLSNSGAIVDIFNHMDLKFDKMYAKRAFVHWYVGEGLDEGFFS
jgi:tubulin alpha